MKASYLNVTEVPGHKATNTQFSIMRTRYNLAKSHSTKESDVLEIACGSGIGLGYLSENAKKVIGGDIDTDLLSYAEKTYEKSEKVSVLELDAQNLPFEDNSFDIVLIYEAIYYFPQIEKAFQEVSRVLKKDGKLIISTVNKDWHGFNPSPFSFKYYSHNVLEKLLVNEAFIVESYCGFEDLPKSSNFIATSLKRTAVKLNLIPKTMKGKEFLKRVFYGKLKPLPNVLTDEIGELEKLELINSSKNLINFKVLYYICQIQKN